MKKIVLGFCVIAFGVSVVMADETSNRLIWNCVERKKFNENKPIEKMQAECLGYFENVIIEMGSSNGSAYLGKNFSFVWTPENQQEAVKRIMLKICKEWGIKESNDEDLHKVTSEINRLVKNDDYKTLGCLYIGNPNVKCLK